MRGFKLSYSPYNSTSAVHKEGDAHIGCTNYRNQRGLNSSAQYHYCLGTMGFKIDCYPYHFCRYGDVARKSQIYVSNGLHHHLAGQLITQIRCIGCPLPSFACSTLSSNNMYFALHRYPQNSSSLREDPKQIFLYIGMCSFFLAAV